MRFVLLLALSSIFISCKTTLVTDATGKPVPQITWDQQTLELGKLKQGEKRELKYQFTNTGSADLEIELVTACNCMTLEWTKGIIPPGGRGSVEITFDSTKQKLGSLKKVIDVIANTDPIVVEAFFTVEILYQNQG